MKKKVYLIAVQNHNIFLSKTSFIVFEYTHKSIKMINHHLPRDYQGWPEN